MPKSYKRVLTALALALALPVVAMANAPPANEHFERIWERTERPVTDRVASRTWIWGPFAATGPISEPYIEAPHGYRTVQYYDKTRMEITNPDGDSESPWFVTNGLLAKEMITGRVQLGHISFIQTEPADVQVAGDQHPDTPTYRTLSHLLDLAPRAPGSTIIERLVRDGNGYETESVPELEEYAVHTSYHVPETNHSIAEPFWEFMNSTGFIRQHNQNVEGPLFEDPFFATGLPIIEAYWVYVPVGGEWQDVLLQCFERRCLTYTPGNSPGWQVEAGNIGRHYHQFRYGHDPLVLDCIDLNVATWEALQTIRNIGPSRAEAILEHRPFESIADLEKVPGIGPVTVGQIKDEGLACVHYGFFTGNEDHQSR